MNEEDLSSQEKALLEAFRVLPEKDQDAYVRVAYAVSQMPRDEQAKVTIEVFADMLKAAKQLQ